MPQRTVAARGATITEPTGRNTFIQGRILRFLRHRYTWQPRVDDVSGGTDDWGNPIQTVAVPPAPPSVHDKPCLFRDRSTVSLGVAGPVQMETNQLFIPWDDPVEIGDLISDIYDPLTGHHFLDTPTRVETIGDSAPSGPLLYRIARLHGAEVR